MNADRVLGLLLARHQGEEWVSCRELRNGTGYSGRRTRTIDFFAMNTWPSKKYARYAYEVKVSRSDLMRELADPGKREPFLELSNEFYYAVAHGVATKDEIPEDCGLILADKGGLKVAKKAPWRNVAPPGLPFMAAFFRALHEAKPLEGLWKYEGREMTKEELLKTAGVEASYAAKQNALESARKEVRLERAQQANVRNAILAAAKTRGLPSVPFQVNEDSIGRWLDEIVGAEGVSHGQLEDATKALQRALGLLKPRVDPPGSSGPLND